MLFLIFRLYQIDKLSAEVKTFNPQRGFGFITCEGLAAQGYGDVFVHQKHIGDYQALGALGAAVVFLL